MGVETFCENTVDVVELDDVTRAAQEVVDAEAALSAARLRLHREITKAVVEGGASFSAVAKIVGVSRQRIAQIVRDHAA